MGTVLKSSTGKKVAKQVRKPSGVYCQSEHVASYAAGSQTSADHAHKAFPGGGAKMSMPKHRGGTA